MYALVEEVVPIPIEFGGIYPGEEDGAGEVVEYFWQVHGDANHIRVWWGKNFYIFCEINGG